MIARASQIVQELYSTPPVSVLLVDDRLDFRQGLQNLLSFYSLTGEARFKIVGQATAVDQALQSIHEQSPNIVLLDFELRDNGGLQLLHQLNSLALSHPPRILVLSSNQDDEQVFRAMQEGAHGYVCKNQISLHLMEAIATLLRGDIYLSSELMTSFFRAFHFYSGKSLPCGSKIHLTEREREVLQCLVDGASNEGISARMNITVGTVKAYLTTIFEKLAVKSRTQAALKALRLGLI
jgi:DNA-binding NarL/FixJ family response regulator